jgi:hypothetical protein
MGSRAPQKFEEASFEDFFGRHKDEDLADGIKTCAPARVGLKGCSTSWRGWELAKMIAMLFS